MIHTNQTICSIHRGSNFLGWHRVYLRIFEAALRQKNRNVSLPYLDSVIDNYRDNSPTPNDSVIFTEEFLGNGKGYVHNGPFKFWTDVDNCNLQRSLNFNNSGTLRSQNTIYKIKYDLTVHHMNQIDYNMKNNTYTLEGQHNIVHDWVGGMMSILDDSPRDPVFFLHHAFVDYIWTKFTQKQERMNVQEKYETVGADIKRHYPNRTMDCFYWLRNVDGRDARQTANVNYEDSPACPNCGDSKYLKCDKSLYRCIPGSTSSVHRPWYIFFVLSFFYLILSILL